MVYYNLKFINELMAAVIEEDMKQKLKESLSTVKYGLILDSVKLRLEQNYYVIENDTFIAMHQKLFKYVTKSKINHKSQRKVTIPLIQQSKS